MIKRYGPWKDSGGWAHVMDEEKDGSYVRYEDVLAALQTLIDQLASNHEWRNGAVLAYNAISCSEFDAAAEPK